MKNWEKFELECYEYLRKKYPNKKVIYHGGSDSTKADIQVDNIFYECKYCPSQCSQFVVYFCDNSFRYSVKNKNAENKFSRNIINFMNSNVNYFSDDTIKNKIIQYPGCEKDFFGCIKENIDLHKKE